MDVRIPLCLGCVGAALGARDVGAQQAPPRLQAVQELRLDAATEDFSTIRTFVVGRDGRIVVPLSQDHNVRVYDAKGTRVATFGRAGEGPGEFKDQFSAIGLRGDTVWIHDFNLRRLTLLSPSNTLLRTMSTVVSDSTTARTPAAGAPGLSMTNLTVEALYTDGTMLVRWPFGPADQANHVLTDYRFVAATPRGEIKREVARLPQSTGRVHHLMPSGGMANASVPFFAGPIVSVASDGSRVATVVSTTSSAGGSYTLTVMRASGDTVFARTYPFVGVRIPSAKVDSALAMMAGRPPEVWQDLRAQATPLVPSIYPPITGLVIGEDDSVWLNVYSADANVRYVLLDGRGNVIGDVVLPKGTTVVRATRAMAWVLEKDADDLQSIVRYRVQAPR